MTDIALKTATELVDLFRRKEASPVDAAEAALARAHRFQEPLNPFVLIDDDSAMAAARESEARWQKGEPAGAIDGVPVTIKDLVYTKGWPTRRGSKAISADQPWEDDAPATARLRESGAVILGKTTTPEMGWKGVTDSPLTGITRNPVEYRQDPRRLFRRRGGGLRRRCRHAACRYRWRRIDPHPVGLHRHLWPQGHLRARAGLALEPLRHHRQRRADGPQRRGCGAHAERHCPAGLARLV